MCDYSLMIYPNRLAQDGEELLVHRFPSGTKGLAARSDLEHEVIPFPVWRSGFRFQLGELGSLLRQIVIPRDAGRLLTAVCIPSGARLLLRDIPEHLQRRMDIGRTEEVTFTQITDLPFTYRDAVHFRNGCHVMLQCLQEGQRVRVLSLSSSEIHPELELLAPAR